MLSGGEPYESRSYDGQGFVDNGTSANCILHQHLSDTVWAIQAPVVSCRTSHTPCTEWTVKDEEDDSAHAHTQARPEQVEREREPSWRVRRRGKTERRGDRWRWLQHPSLSSHLAVPPVPPPETTSPLLMGLRQVAAVHRAGRELPCIIYQAEICRALRLILTLLTLSHFGRLLFRTCTHSRLLTCEASHPAHIFRQRCFIHFGLDCVFSLQTGSQDVFFTMQRNVS